MHHVSLIKLTLNVIIREYFLITSMVVISDACMYFKIYLYNNYCKYDQ